MLGEDGDDFLAGMKKKKKSSLKKPSGDAAAEEGTAADGDAEDGGDLDFSSLKKKKKKRVIENQVAELEARLEEAGVVADKEAEGAEGEDLFAKPGEEVEEVSPEDEEAAWLKSDRDYTYEEVHSSQIFHMEFYPYAEILAVAQNIPYPARKQSFPRPRQKSNSPPSPRLPRRFQTNHLRQHKRHGNPSPPSPRPFQRLPLRRIGHKRQCGCFQSLNSQGTISAKAIGKCRETVYS